MYPKTSLPLNSCQALKNIAVYSLNLYRLFIFDRMKKRRCQGKGCVTKLGGSL